MREFHVFFSMCGTTLNLTQFYRNWKNAYCVERDDIRTERHLESKKIAFVLNRYII
jgi:hypothetical protein